jgi:hypothetical protein
MIVLKKEIITKTYREKDILIETVRQFHYASEEERNNHISIMANAGFNDSGQVKENVGTIENPNYVWFASLYKIETEE